MENKINISSPAKVNLCLYVTGRTSSHHLLKMLNVRIGLSDEIEISINDPMHEGLYVKNIVDEALNSKSSNLAWRAKNKFCEFFNIEDKFGITIQKNIPIGAGLGGGSSNAAYILRTLADIYLGLKNNFDSDENLMNLAQELGADVPFFLTEENSSYVVTGIGEKIIPYKGYIPDKLYLIFPNFGVSTEEVFKIHRLKSLPLSTSEKDLILGANDLENAACMVESKLTLVLNDFRRVTPKVSLSGSGSTIYCWDLSDEEVDKLTIFTKKLGFTMKVVVTT